MEPRSVMNSAVLPVLGSAIMLLSPGTAAAQAACPEAQEVVAGLEAPLGITRTPLGNLVVTESGGGQNDGRISIVTPAGEKRLLLSGLPSGINDVGDTSGPAGVHMRGRTLYVLLGIGDTIKRGPVPGTAVANSNPSSPIFSSLLAVHFSANVEKTTRGFSMSLADQQTLKAGQRVTLSDGGGDSLTIELVADFPDYVPRPEIPLAGIVRGSNPYGIAVAADQAYVTDGGRNLLFKVDVPSGAFSVLAEFPNIPNPLPVGPPLVEAVPTGVAYAKGQLLVTLFRGAPFPPGFSVVESVDGATGQHAPFIGGLKTAISVLPVNSRPGTDHLVLQYDIFAGPFFGGPGRLLRYPSPGAAPQVISDCLLTPTSMVFDENLGRLYVAEEGLTPSSGRIVALPLTP